MANAQPEDEIRYWNDDIESEDEDEASSSKHNGTATPASTVPVDRFGFLGGEQYTDPAQ